MKDDLTKITLLRNRDWKLVEGNVCRVISFMEWAKASDGKVTVSVGKTTPYAVLHIECTTFGGSDVTGYVCHRVDFLHLWAVFRDRGVGPDEEVLVAWNASHERGLIKLFSFMLPKLAVMVCPKGAYELLTNPDFMPELGGEARYVASKPIVWLKPMEER